MDFQQLKYFNSLAMIGNMTKAAMNLNISQSTLSKSITRLESEIGCSLFTRNGRNITLNAAGKTFFEYSVKILDALDVGVKKTLLVNSPDEPRVRVCISGACNEMIRCISQFEVLHPNVYFEIDGVLDYEEAPDINDYDVMVCPDSPRYSRFEGYSIGIDKMCLCVSKKHPLAEKIAVSVKDLNNLDTVFLKSGDDVESVQWGLDVLSVHPGKKYYVNNRDLHRQMIAENIAAGYILDGASRQYSSDDSLKVLPILDNRFAFSMKIVFKRATRMSAEAKEFRDFAVNYFNLKIKEDDLIFHPA